MFCGPHSATMMMMIKAMVFLANFIALTTSLSSTNLKYQPKIVNGQNCLLVPCVRESPSPQTQPMLVLLGGMAQTISAWEHHLPALAQSRDVLVYECIGQGRIASDTEQAFPDVSLPFQAERLMVTIRTIHKELHLSGPNKRSKSFEVDLVGFSLGARICMAAAATFPDNVRRMHLTGVAADRSDYGHLAMMSCGDLLGASCSVDISSAEIQNHPLRPFAWCILLATYSSSFLRQQGPRRLEQWISHICTSNSPQGLAALSKQTEITNVDNQWHVVNMAKEIHCPVHLCAGENDEMAPTHEVYRLAERLSSCNGFTILPDCAHAVAIESPKEWRDSIISFLG